MAEAAWFILLQILALVVLTVSALVFGRALLARVHYHSAGERTVFALGTGLGAIGWLLFVSGLFRLLYAPLLALLFFAAHALCWREWRAVWAERQALRSPLLLFAAIFAVPPFLLSLYPPTGFDETMYHLPYARLFVREHGVVFAESLRFPIFPQLAHLVFTPILMFAGASATHAVQFFSAAVTALGVACWARELEGDRSALWSAAIWIGSPLVIWFAATSYIDLTLTLFVLLAFRAVTLWSGTGQHGHVLVAGLMAGFAAGTKYHGLVIVILCAATALISSRRSVRPAMMFVAGVTVAMGPFYLRNLALTGNPVFPFFGRVFGYSPWSPSTPGPPLATRLQNLVELPWGMVADSVRRSGQPPYSPFVLLLLPFALYYALRNRSLRGPVLMILLYGAIVSSAVRVLPTDVRFLLPTAAVLAVPAGAALDRLSRRLRTPAYGFAVALLLASPGLVYGAFKLWERGPVPFGEDDRARYITRLVPAYPLIAELNRLHGSSYTLYTVYGENLRWYIEGRGLGDRFGPSRYRDVITAAVDSRSLARHLRRLGADYILFNRRSFAIPPGPELVRVAGWGEYEVWAVSKQ